MEGYLTKRDLVYNQIKSDILSGKLRPGDRLNISTLAKNYSISEIPVREAVQVLDSEKLIQIIPHTGAIVAAVSKRDLDEILELRVYFEGLATYLAGPYLTEADVKKLEKNLKKQSFTIEMNELDDFGELNLQFHSLIYDKCPNSRLREMIVNLWDHSKRYRTVFEDNFEFTKGSYEEHKLIFNALQNQNFDLAHDLMKQHKQRSSDEIKSKWTME